MKLLLQKAISLRGLAAIAISSILFSFAPPKGGEGFEIYLGDHLILRQYGAEMKDAKTVHLDSRYSNEQLTVKYWHCGRIGKDRTITLRDGQNRLLKQWHFANSTEAVPPMNCSVQEILKLTSGNVKELKLYYSSTELPAGRLLASIEIGSGNKTS